MGGHRWFVLQVMSGLERAVVDQIRGIIEWNGCFLAHSWEEAGGRRRFVPRFPGYLFVRVDLDLTPYWETINTVRGAVHMLPQKAERPTPLPVGFVEELIELYRDGPPEEEALDGLLANYARGDVLRIESGPFEGHEGSFTRKARGHVELLVSLLGREFPLLVPPHQVSRVVASRAEDDRTKITTAGHSPQFGRRRGERPRLEAA